MRDSGDQLRRDEGGRLVRSLASGAVAGGVATAVMTGAMGAMAAATRGPLAPKQVTGWLVERTHSARVEDPARTVLTMVNHFGYGSALGALYGLLRRRSRASLASGVAYGVMVWAVNYAGLLPALGVVREPATDDTTHAVRIHVAHWVYGAAIGTVLARIRRRARPLAS